jgi:hypothetical protein
MMNRVKHVSQEFSRSRQGMHTKKELRLPQGTQGSTEESLASVSSVFLGVPCG